jgi:heat shock protein HslJ
MRKILIAIVVIAILAGAADLAVIAVRRLNPSNAYIHVSNIGVLDFKDATYTVEGEAVALKQGIAETYSTSSTAAKTTRYFGDQASGDFNNDGRRDVVFILTQTDGGSGTFYYVAAAILTADGYYGTNAILLGDRIAPQSTEIKTGQIIVNYADRKEGEPFTTPPSVGISRYFKIVGGQLVEVNDISKIINRDWRWVKTALASGAELTPKKVGDYYLNFKDDGSVSGHTDCNSFSASYKSSDNSLTFGLINSTMMYCDGSQEATFEQELGGVEAYTVDRNNNLVLEMKSAAGTMVFE